jgi:hypothetical protein
MKYGRPKRVLAIAIAICCAALLVWYFWGGRRSQTEEDEGAQAPSRVSTQQGERIIALDEATQTRSGVVTSPLKPMTYKKELKAYGTVLDLQPLSDLHKALLDSRKNLADLRNNFGVATAQAEKAKVSLDASRKEYERLAALHKDDRNVSDKALQAGEVTWRSEDANVRASQQGLNSAQEALHTGEQSLGVLQDSARQQWGNVIAGWLFEGSPAFERLRQRLDLLVQITLPSDVRIPSPPDSVRVHAGSGTIVTARLVSPSPKTDPKIQGMSFFYLAPSQKDILQGMDVRAYLPVGQTLQGLFIPASAAVWWQGKTWAYVQKDLTHFVRREISTEMPVQGGWFIPKGFSAEDRIVTEGAELILSEEFRSQIEKEEE